MSMPQKIIRPYEMLLTAFADACVSANKGSVSALKSPQACFKRISRDGQWEFSFKAHCKGWPERSKSRKHISILVQAQETVDPMGNQLESSTVRLNYLRPVNGGLSLAQSVHFDFAQPQDEHAVFHAQVSDELITLDSSEINELNLDSVPTSATPTQIRSTRIPTCDMTLSSVMICLVADHVGGLQFEEFYKKVKKLQPSLPKPNIETLRRSLGQECPDVRSTHWFAHQFSKQSQPA